MSIQSKIGSDADVLHKRGTAPDTHSEPQATNGETRELTEALEHVVAAGKSRLTQWKGELHHGIGERPLQAIAIAAGVGAVLGLVIGLRSR